MSGWIKLLIPLTLGLAAGGLNYLALQSRLEPSIRQYIKLTKDVKAGQRFQDAMFEAVAIDESLAGSLKDTAVAYADRATLFNRPAPREFKKGDLLLYRDTVPPPGELEIAAGEAALPVSLENLPNVPEIIPVGSAIEFLVARPRKPTRPGAGVEPLIDYTQLEAPERIGPFRVLSVGDRLATRPMGDTGSRVNPNNKVLNVAIQLAGSGGIDATAKRLMQVLQAEQETGKRIMLGLVLLPASASSNK